MTEPSSTPKPEKKDAAASEPEAPGAEAEGTAKVKPAKDAAKAKAKAPSDKAASGAEKPDVKPARERKKTAPTEPISVRAQAKYVRTSPRKARVVCDHIRGKRVEEARSILAFSPRSVGKDWSKVLESAVANAEHNHELVGDDLRIESVFADAGPTLKRIRPRARGRMNVIRKRTAHLTITLTSKE